MSNSWTAKAALLVIATTISFSSPATSANEPRPTPQTIAARQACRDLVDDARATCEILRSGVGAVFDGKEPAREQARGAAERLCRRWTELAAGECIRGIEAAK